MNGYELYKKAAVRLGYYDENVNDTRLIDRAIELINQIAQDLRIKEISSLSDEIEADSANAEALCCGLVMLLALTEGDAEKNQLYTSLYNAKRAALLSEVSHIKDTLPKAENGGV